MEESRLFAKCQRELGLLLGDNYTPILVQAEPILLTELRFAPGAPDYTYSLELPTGRAIRIAVEIKRNLRAAMIPLLMKQRDTWLNSGSYEQLMIFTDRVSQGIRDQLRNNSIWFVDEAGNAHLEIEGHLLINVMGRKPRHPSKVKGQYYSLYGSRVLLFLIENGPEVEATYQDVQGYTGVSSGKISQVITELLDSDVVARRSRGSYLVINPARLLEMWTSSFIEKALPRLLLGRYQSPYGKEFGRMLHEHGDLGTLRGVSVGGEFAADLLTGNLQPSSISLYVPPSGESEVRKAFTLAPAADGDIILYQTFVDAGVISMPDVPLDLAAPPIVFAELLSTSDSRCGETADIVRERWFGWLE